MRQLPNLLAWPGVPLAVGSAVLFAASTPFAKLLLGSGVNPWLLAGLLYLGSGLGLYVVHFCRQQFGIARRDAPLRQGDLPWLVLVILSGGVIGPVLLMVGLTTTAASTSALLLNLEGLATMGIAWLVFRENVDRKLLAGAAAILAGAFILSWQAGPKSFGLGSLAITCACVAWGIDNNLTRKLSAADPVQTAMVKGLAAGAVNLTLALMTGASLPASGPLLVAAGVGFLGYGVSLVMFVLALRHLGAARTGAYFSTAPFIGAGLAIAMFGEPITLELLAAAALMSVGLALHLMEGHEHQHEHEPMEHEHRHTHDAHHQHRHSSGDPEGEPHTHVHRHTRVRHSHPHYPDIHHRHGHDSR